MYENNRIYMERSRIESIKDFLINFKTLNKSEMLFLEKMAKRTLKSLKISFCFLLSILKSLEFTILLSKDCKILFEVFYGKV